MSADITIFHNAKRDVYCAVMSNFDGRTFKECPRRKTRAEAESDACKLGRETGVFVVGAVYDENGEPTSF